ncbi:MAG: VOC family protein [Akkermansiaceae bacterium]
MFNHFTWCEVNSFDLSEAECFYENVFSWRISEPIKNYRTCYSEEVSVAGMLGIPGQVSDAALHSRWLSYVSVDSLHDMVNLAVELGGKIETHSRDFYRGGEVMGKFALLNDPTGARLMLYEGEDLRVKDSGLRSDGRMALNELHVNSMHGVRQFYEKLLGWKFESDPSGYGRFLIFDMKGRKVASLLELDKKVNVKAERNCWMVYFTVNNVDETLKRISKYGGLVIVDLANTGYGFSLVQDTQGAFFCISQNEKLAN